MTMRIIIVGRWEIVIFKGFLSVITIFISGIISWNFENNFIIMILKFRLIAYYHLLVHAIFKSMFIAAGVVMHSMKNIQDIRLLRNLNEVFKNRVNIFIIFIIIILSLLLTVSYSIRLIYYLFFNRRIKFYRYVRIKED
ncbi:NU5M oxidoreductase, partial [Pseudoatta argentina]